MSKKLSFIFLIGKFLTPHCLPLSKQQQQPQQPQQIFPANMFPPSFTIEYRYFTNPTSLTKRDIELNEFNMKQAQSFIRNALKNFFFDHLIKTNSNSKIRDLWLKVSSTFFFHINCSLIYKLEILFNTD